MRAIGKRDTAPELARLPFDPPCERQRGGVLGTDQEVERV